jgi:hypothetical protein
LTGKGIYLDIAENEQDWKLLLTMYNKCIVCGDVAEEQRLVVIEDSPHHAIARWYCRRHAWVVNTR